MMEKLQLLAISADDVGIPEVKAGDVLANGLHLVYWTVGIVAVVTIIIAGYMYVTSSGDPAAATKAKNMILYSAIGIVVVMLAFVITQFVLGRF
jgi:hypothetical protein